ncbi:phage tail tape measure protein [Novosphingobium sp. SL115]|uniref:phage tail tape measure protein n=1 Tax=Novosphingobium sp. SL115 TaxID=2995150 RepID=UPI0022754746|nr:phage tail tape measure protein [Novosphingobium sp. SL115]MCY1672131.1 phage tail tape measure protein [Novosphingobium sp. SL115]
MSNKLNLLVNFIGHDKMSGALRNIIGLGRDGSKSIRALNGEAKKLEREMAKVRREIGKGTGNVTELMNRERDLENQLRQTNEQLKRQRRLAALNADDRAMRRAAGEYTSRGQDNLIGGAAMGVPLAFAAKQAMAFESAMADVRKVVNFDTPKQFAQMGNDVLDLSTKIPMAAGEIAQIVAAAGRANIPRKELLGFAQDAAKMGVAFDMTGDEAGGMMAKWRTAFGLSQGGVTALADQINALTNTYGGNATAVSGIVTRIGALGQVAGLSSSQVGAMAQLLNSVGVEEEVAATGIKNMMLALTKGTAATKGQQAALSSLGLEAGSIAKGMQKDASGTITTVLSKISKLPKDMQASLLGELFGTESVSAIAPMLTNLDKLQTNFAMVGDKAAYAGSMQKEYLARVATTEGATGLALNGLQAVNIELGKYLLPTIVTASQKILELSRSVRAWSNAHPQLSSALVQGFAYLVAFRVGLGALQVTFGTLLGPFAAALKFFRMHSGIIMMSKTLGQFVNVGIRAGGMAVRVFGVMRTAALFLAQGVMRAGAMMLANPMVLAIVAIGVAIGVLAYLVYTNWSKIKTAFATGWQWVKDTLSAAPQWLRSLGSSMMQGLLSMIDPFGLRNRLLDVARNGIAAFKNFFGIKSPSRLLMQMGGHLTTGLAKGIDQGRNAPLHSMSRMASGVAKAGAVSLSPISPASRPVTQGGALGGGLSPIIVQVYGAQGQSVDDLANAVIRKLEQVKGVRARSSYEGDR